MKDFDWIDRSYDLCEEKKDDQAIDVILDNLDDALCEKGYEHVDECLRRVDPERLSGSAMITFLCITHTDKDKLAARESLVLRIESALSKIRTPEQVEKLLRNTR